MTDHFFDNIFINHWQVAITGTGIDSDSESRHHDVNIFGFIHMYYDSELFVLDIPIVAREYRLARRVFTDSEGTGM
jgi:hypothetical protein